MVVFLVESGSDISERANEGDGPTPLHLAISSLGEDHSVVSFLKSLGAVNIGPDL